MVIRWAKERQASWLRYAGKSTLNLAFPAKCAVCQITLAADADLLICLACQQALKSGNVNPCPRCAFPNHVSSNLLGLNPKNQSISGCAHCVQTQLHFQQTVALGVYRDALREVVIRMKHAHEEMLTVNVGRLLAVRVLENPSYANADLVIPVPTHWLRRLSRGYNVAEILGQSISRLTGIPRCDRMLKATRRTQKQGTLRGAARARNVRGAFAVRLPDKLQGASILLIDDVVTTGSTLNEIARECRQQGAAQISCVVVARALGVS
jgi:ComF family protein